MSFCLPSHSFSLFQKSRSTCKEGDSTPLSNPSRRVSPKVSWPNPMSQKELPGESTGPVVIISGLNSGFAICELYGALHSLCLWKTAVGRIKDPGLP